jgi:hypothetical protein
MWGERKKKSQIVRGRTENTIPVPVLWEKMAVSYFISIT